jgi:hypothetical protein
VRINLNWVNAFLIASLHDAPGVTVLRDGYDIVWAETPHGHQVAIHLIEREISVEEIQRILQENAAAGRYTLIFLWSAMLLPEHGEDYRPYDWMYTLLNLYDGCIYAYENYGENVWLYPVYFDEQPGTTYRKIRYGEAVDMGRLYCETVFTENSNLNGQWRIAGIAQRPHMATGQNGNRREQAVPRPQGPIKRCYDVLGVAYDADLEAIRRAFRALALQYHPDLNKAPDAHARMQEILTAYQKIVDWWEQGSPT